jgi:pilus assembly protein CpaB
VKRISPATVTFGVMAIVLGLVAAYVVRQSWPKPIAAPPPPAPAPAPKPDLVPVVFARVNLPVHTRVSAADLYVAHVAKEAKAAHGTFRGPSLAEGRITTQTIRAGQAIRDEYLMEIGAALPDLAERLPPGTRAVTIEVEGADTGGKRLSEGDYVDLAMTVEGTHPDLGEVMTRTLLRSVLVVDAQAGRPLVRKTKATEDPQPSMITVAVNPSDANKLIVAERTGTLVATLVSLKDIEAGEIAPLDDAITRRELLGLKEVPVPPAPKKYTIEKWSGSNVQIFEMSDDRIRESREVGAPRRSEVQTSQPAQDDAAATPSGIKVPAAVAAASRAF